MQIISILKVIKRLFWDVWLVLPNILVDLKAGKNVRRELPELYGQGFMYLPNLSSGELSELKSVYTDHMNKEGISVSGQLNGRVFQHGLIDERLRPLIGTQENCCTIFEYILPHLELTYFQKVCQKSTLTIYLEEIFILTILRLRQSFSFI